MKKEKAPARKPACRKKKAEPAEPEAPPVVPTGPAVDVEDARKALWERIEAHVEEIRKDNAERLAELRKSIVESAKKPAEEPAAKRPAAHPSIGIGRIVHYCLTDDDAARINHRRIVPGKPEDPGADPGPQSHVGSRPAGGQLVPLVVCRVEAGAVYGQALLDGNDSYWIQDAREGTEPGTWRWAEVD